MERRRCIRLQTRKGAAAALGGSRTGMIADISREGLSFRFIGSAHENQKMQQRSSTVSIIYDDFILTDLHCTIVTDRYLLKRYATYLSLNLFKCCIQFKKMAANQKSHLEYFMLNYSYNGKCRNQTSPLYEKFINRSVTDNLPKIETYLLSSKYKEKQLAAI